ncbi:MAG TPA: glutamine-hydrolyzing carbamoyl-phosphate synthase small subunit [Candidatus Bathyarchaeia archaeon]|nr:glutamine-hydrolyzing carbamoyl-phosphate synthase small subunit [Candidatus Bathyarchaeia archaeon]
MERAEPDKRGVLVLEDGSVFQGVGFGAETEISGEVVFNTSMMGYPELLTDPSYQEQIVVMTYPILGSYGVPPSTIRNGGGVPLHFESDSVKVKGFAVHSLSRPSHWSNHTALDEWLTEQGVPGISGVDTRVLTQRLRNKGTMLGVLRVSSSTIDPRVVATGVSQLRDPNNDDLVHRVSPKEPIYYDGEEESTIVIVDCGVKYGILRSLLAKGARIVRVPYDFPSDKILALNPRGIVISNGPGDPKIDVKTIETAKNLMETDLPIMGICLGAQILGLAAAAETYKLKFGHRAVNHPCMDLETGRCFITTQNHGFTIDRNSLENTDFLANFVNVNDKTVEGIKHRKKPFLGIQWHPESSPGPYDTRFLFDRFIEEALKA